MMPGRRRCWPCSQSSRRRTAFSAGQSMVEMALLIPVMALLLVAACDFARVFFARMELIGAARAGAAYGAQNRITAADSATMRSKATASASDVNSVTASATSFCVCSGSTVSCTNPGACSNLQVFVQVDTYTTFRTLATYPGVPSSIPLHATAILPVY